MTTLTGSALLALALFHGVRSADEVWAAAHVDEDWNIEKWGIDEEVAARRAARLVDFTAAVTILKALSANQRHCGAMRIRDASVNERFTTPG